MDCLQGAKSLDAGKVIHRKRRLRVRKLRLNNTILRFDQVPSDD